jgi:hypothetical protein
MAMFSLISLPKHGGGERSKLFDNLLINPDWVRKAIQPLLLLLFVVCSSWQPAKSATAYRPSRAAAASFNLKLNILEEHEAGQKPPKSPLIQFSQNEVNSYLALDLKPQYHPCLKSLIMTFEEDNLQGVADIDFDLLGESSSKLGPKLLGLMFSGTHTLSAQGKLVSKNGKAFFQLEKASFDGGTLPKSLIEKIISLVGRKQDPPFDPLTPSELPYRIDHVVVHSGYALVFL